MNHYVKQFLLRGMAFGGFGPIIAGVVYWILSFTIPSFTLTGGEMCLAIVTTYLLAFVHAGASVFNQIEHWPIMKSLLCHFATLYVGYVLCYLINAWIPFDLAVIAVFTAIFIVVYLLIWGIVYASVKAAGKKLSRQL